MARATTGAPDFAGPRRQPSEIGGYKGDKTHLANNRGPAILWGAAAVDGVEFNIAGVSLAGLGAYAAAAAIGASAAIVVRFSIRRGVRE
jgi:hypothetical protein